MHHPNDNASRLPAMAAEHLKAFLLTFESAIDLYVQVATAEDDVPELLEGHARNVANMAARLREKRREARETAQQASAAVEQMTQKNKKTTH